MADILLVDDDPVVVARNIAALEAEGHAVKAVTTTADARRHLAAGEPDVVVLEAMLDGGMAGFDLARALARRNPSLPVIMLTRVDEHFTREQRQAQDRDGWLPVDRYLQKPVMPSVLLSEVEHLAKAAA